MGSFLKFFKYTFLYNTHQLMYDYFLTAFKNRRGYCECSLSGRKYLGLWSDADDSFELSLELIT